MLLILNAVLTIHLSVCVGNDDFLGFEEFQLCELCKAVSDLGSSQQGQPTARTCCLCTGEDVSPNSK